MRFRIVDDRSALLASNRASDLEISFLVAPKSYKSWLTVIFASVLWSDCDFSNRLLLPSSKLLSNRLFESIINLIWGSKFDF